VRPIAAAAGIAAALALAGPAAGFAQGEVLENEDILSLTAAGLPPEVIVAKIESTATAFDTSVEKLVALVQAGVHADVLAAMAKASASTSAASEPPADDPVGDIKHLEVMGCGDDGEAFSAVEVSYKVNDFTAGNSIKVGCGFVRQYDGWVVCKCAGNGNALALSTG